MSDAASSSQRGVDPPGADVYVEGMLFDMDGVLVSSVASAIRCWRQWARHYGVPDADHFELPHGVRAVEIMERLKPGIDVMEGLQRIEAMEIADVADIQVLPGVAHLLHALPKDRWAVVTSATRPLLLARLGAAGLPVPDRLISAETVQKGKPDPEPYRRGAEMLGFAPHSCLVVEDAASGVRAGVAAGCRVLGIEGTQSAMELQEAGATWVVRSLAEVTVTTSADGLALQFRGTPA